MLFAGAHHDFFLNALAQGKVDQVVHILRIKHLGELLLLYKLKRNLRRLEIKFPQRRSLFIHLYPNGKIHVSDTCVQNYLEQAQNLLPASTGRSNPATGRKNTDARP